MDSSPQAPPALRRIAAVESYLGRARELFASRRREIFGHSRAAEWFLDNYFLVRKAVRQVRHDMPRSFLRELPAAASGDLAGLPRVHGLAQSILGETGLLPDRGAIESLVETHPDAPSQTMAELWALPAFLRLGVIEELAGAVARIFPEDKSPLQAVAPPGSMDDDDVVASAVCTLREFDGIDWRAVFRHCSLVERVLERDPARVYRRMDFATQDRCRKAVERIARRTGRGELELAHEAVAMSHRFVAKPGPRSHVGYFLIDDGVRELERAVGYRPALPEGCRRFLLARPTATLLGGIAVATTGAMVPPAWYLAAQGASAGLWLAGMALALLPASTLGVTVVHWFLTHVLPPRVLPKMSFGGGIPSDCKTAVVVPCLLGSAGEVQDLVRQLELHYLRNPDPSLRFALLTDYVDAPEKRMPGDEALLHRAEAGVRLLNRKYGRSGKGPFHLLHRERRWNASEGVWMGWERKRGKLEELNAFLLGEADGTAFSRRVGNERALEGVSYVITLDAGTVLPRGAAARLVGTLAHPLNRAESGPAGGVARGYTVVQPRVEIAPMCANRSWFARLFAGDGAIDIYSRAVSDVYQDLCGQGIYVGKGIYDLEAFHTVLTGRVPENALVSHDHFEGLHGRVALATDVLLFEDYPAQYLAYTRRMHRWMRGDWQLLPWLRSRVRDASGRRVSNAIPPFGRWVLFDNLRRSLLTPVLILLLAAGWIWLPGHPLVWTLAALLAPAGHVFTGLVTSVIRGARRTRIRPWAAGATKSVRENGGRWLLYVVFLGHEAFVVLDAVIRTLVRLCFSRRRLLEWRTAEHTAQLLTQRGPHALVWSEMIASPVLALALGAGVLAVHPAALPYAAPLLLLWLLAPEIARRISLRLVRQTDVLDPRERAFLRLLARRTWFFFESFVGPEDQWLPPDNYQEEPLGEVAHRTSPTNIGMFLTSTLAAHDFGYLGLSELAFRLRRTFETLGRMERYRGHLFNWYDTRTLQPLQPRYVSTVDSGNLAASLLVVEYGCASAAARGAVLDGRRWDGLADAVELLNRAVLDVQDADPSFRCETLLVEIAALRGRILETRDRPETWSYTLLELSGPFCSELDRLLLEALTTRKRGAHPSALRGVRLWLDRLHRQLQAMRRDLDAFAPWLELLSKPPAALVGNGGGDEVGSAWRLVRASLPVKADVANVIAALGDARPALERLEQAVADAPLDEERLRETRAWCEKLRGALASAGSKATEVRRELLGIGAEAESEVRGMDFGLLYDRSRHLFHIGFNATEGEPDANHYDLLASEARIASFLAIGKGDVPVKHWFFLGRPLTCIRGRTALLSWGATMFEYLMPRLWMESAGRTLLDQSARAAVDAQIDYGKRHHAPWGVSESGFFLFDARNNYQYRSFGVPGLGLRRGLSEDLVVAPYASALALELRPRAVVRNLRRLEESGVGGTYGLYEAVDYTPDRVPRGRGLAVVRAYMAHHQGMILSALDNFMYGDALVRRFHASSLVQAAELLLHEQVPVGVALERDADGAAEEAPLPVPMRRTLEPWTPSGDGARREAHLLSNGRMTATLTDASGGWLRWNGLDLTRRCTDPTREDTGQWIYLRDEEDGRLWSAGRNPTGRREDGESAVFHAHMVEYHRREHGILARLEVAVAPRADAEVRYVTLVNESGRRRRLSVTSCAEPVLAPHADDRRHPAFSKLFVESELVPEEEALLFHRRLRSDDERPVVLLHRLLADGRRVRLGGHETDRGRFLGRGRSFANPAALDPGAALGNTTGRVLDPVMALRGVADLEPFATARFAFVTVAAGSRAGVLELARRFRSLGSIDWVFRDAEAESQQEVQQLHLKPELLPAVQRLGSALLYPCAAFRCTPATIELNRLGKPRLWGHGISGDHPIVLLLLGDPKDASVLPELLDAHTLWRRRNLAVDIVLLFLGSSGYAGEDEGRVLRLISERRASDRLHQPGGIFLVHADQVPPEERTLLHAAARVVLDGSRGGLADQAGRLGGQSQHPAPFQPPLLEAPPVEEVPPLKRSPDLLFDNGLGGFTGDGAEYVCHLEPEVRTPAPWCNVLANPRFGCLVSEGGLGCTWAQNASQRRLTPWSNDPVSDPAGEAVYLRDEETGAVWSTTPLPAGEPDACRITHGAGYTEYRRNSRGLEQRMRVFVPRDDPLKVVELELTNAGARARRVTVTYCAELVLGEAREEFAPHTVVEYDDEDGALLARNPWNPDFAERVAFLAAAETPHGVTADRNEFLGLDGDVRRPAALERWGLSGRLECGVDPCLAMMVHVDLEAGATRNVRFVFGDGDDRAHALDLVRRYRERSTVDVAWEELRGFWERFLGAVTVRTPEPAMDVLLNRWLPYQALSSRIDGRTGFYQSSGAFGFRDQLQDVMALMHGAPERARAHLLAAAGRQFEAGDVLHWWHPPGGRGVRTRCSDDLMWLPFVTAHYVRCTGDRGILDEEVPFLESEPLREGEAERYGDFATTPRAHGLLEHCRRALEYGLKLGPHGLPLIGGGDWNDGMNRVGAKGLGESVWLAWFAIAAVRDFAALLEDVGDRPEAERWRRRAEELRRATEAAAWDGAWYLRAWYDEGAPLGSAGSDECRIDLIAQAWAAISGAGSPERVRRALASAEEGLVRQNSGLVLLLDPPFHAARDGHDPGYIRGYPPGVRENGGQYTHAAAWLGWAFVAQRDGDRAARILRLLNPITRSRNLEEARRYRVEPYVIAADVYRGGSHTGRGGWTWYTGAAAWTWRLGIEGVLGIRRVAGDLEIAPCIPRQWKSCEAVVRGAEWECRIRIEDPGSVGRGVAEVTLDGERLPTNVVPLRDLRGPHEVRVRLGASRTAESKRIGG